MNKSVLDVRLKPLFSLVFSLWLILPSVSFGSDEVTVYSRQFYEPAEVMLTKDGKGIQIFGSIKYGLTKKVKRLLKKEKSVEYIVLTSPGGKVNESFSLGKLIKKHGLDTYAYKGCYSACTTPFIYGKKRALVPPTRLGFHRIVFGNGIYEGVLWHRVNIIQHQKKKLYKKQGVAEEFIDKMFDARYFEMWYPRTKELQEGGVIHEILYRKSFEYQ